jgi:cellulose biosynthesis protein BcsQ
MPATDRPDQVITFYSYKGGTGRSMALANIASVLARRPHAGKGILMIDWDLEVPGLHCYFRAQLKKQLGITDDRILDEHPGLIDFFWELHAKLQPQNGARKKLMEEDDAIALLEEIDLRRFILDTDIPSLSLLKAGRFTEEYASQVNTFPWETFYHQAPLLLRVFAETLAEQYRYVLIDSRTGLTDVSGICTMLLPEKLVVVFTPNRQSLTGILGLVQRATNYRRQSDDLRPLVVFPLASRIEPTENTLRQYWRKGTPNGDIVGYQSQFEQMFLQVYGLQNCHLDTYFNHALIQHVPPYAYGENIAVLAERRGESLVLAQRYETFAQLLINTRAPWDGAVATAIGENGNLTREESPYRALLPFHEADEEFFFGRQEVVEQLRQRLVLHEQPFLVIDGPSGSGKTSLLQAGVIPTLREERPTWDVLLVQPGTDPFTVLQQQGFFGAEQDLVATVRHWLQAHPAQDRLVLILDQFETVLLNCPVPVRERFLSQLEQTRNAKLALSIVVVMRNDLVPILSQYLSPSLFETWRKPENTFCQRCWSGMPSTILFVSQPLPSA